LRQLHPVRFSINNRMLDFSAFPSPLRDLVTATNTPQARPSAPWLDACLFYDMSTLTFRVDRKSGDYVKPILAPANDSEQSHFGLLDGVIVGFFLTCVAGLIYLLLQI